MYIEIRHLLVSFHGWKSYKRIDHGVGGWFYRFGFVSVSWWQYSMHNFHIGWNK